jgi:hypothetical protein
MERNDDGSYVVTETSRWDYRDHVEGGLEHFRRGDLNVDLQMARAGEAGEAGECLVQGDVKLLFFDKEKGKDKMFTVWFHTGFVNDDFLCFDKVRCGRGGGGRCAGSRGGRGYGGKGGVQRESERRGGRDPLGKYLFSFPCGHSLSSAHYMCAH